MKKMMFLVGFLFVLIVMRVQAKKVSRLVNLNDLKILPGTVFLTKFDIGAGKGSFSIKYE